MVAGNGGDEGGLVEFAVEIVMMGICLWVLARVF